MITAECFVQKGIRAFEGLRQDQYLNCCQSTIAALAGLVSDQPGALMKLGTGFGGGFAGMGRTCGVLTGGIILISAKYGVTLNDSYEQFKARKDVCKEEVRAYLKWFLEENQVWTCFALTGIDTSTSEGMEDYTDRKQKREVPCYRIIEKAIRKPYEVLAR